MSRTYSIACMDCKQSLWIGQASCESKRIYSGNEAIMGELESFLYAHEGHNLKFVNDCEEPVVDFEEFLTLKAPSPPETPT